MPSIAAKTAKIIAKYARPCTITPKTIGTGSNKQVGVPVASFIRIGKRADTVVNGVLTAGVSAIAPASPAIPIGAVINVNGKTYTVQSVLELWDHRESSYKQNLVLT